MLGYTTQKNIEITMLNEMSQGKILFKYYTI